MHLSPYLFFILSRLVMGDDDLLSLISTSRSQLSAQHTKLTLNKRLDKQTAGVSIVVKHPEKATFFLYSDLSRA
jgi:23S rRNA-/tRNA-specific pseudouridylate synthase